LPITNHTGSKPLSKFKPILAATLAAPLALGACSSSGAKSSSGGSSGGAIKLLVISQLQASNFAFPEIADGAQAAAAATNATGGVNGHKIQVDTCNDQGDPNVASTCGRTAVQGGYAGVLNVTSLYSASFMPLLEAGKVPAVGSTPLTGPDFTSPVSFPIVGGNPLDYGGVGFIAAKTCKSAGIIRDTTAATDHTTAFLEKGFAAGGGGTITTVVKAASTDADFAAPVSEIASSGVDCVLLAEAPAAAAKIVGAVRQSSKPSLSIHTFAPAFPAVLIKALGKAADNVVVNDSANVPSEHDTHTFWADMTKYAPNAVKDGQSLRGWAAVQTVKQVASAAKAYDHTSLLAALEKASSVTVEGLAQTIDFAQPNANKDVARVFATSNYAWVVKNGGYTPLFDSKPIDVSAVLK